MVSTWLSKWADFVWPHGYNGKCHFSPSPVIMAPNPFHIFRVFSLSLSLFGSYRDLLDQWRMWFCRCDFDITYKSCLVSEYLSTLLSNANVSSRKHATEVNSEGNNRLSLASTYEMPAGITTGALRNTDMAASGSQVSQAAIQAVVHSWLLCLFGEPATSDSTGG